MTALPDIWPFERIRTLTKPELRNLRNNALSRGNQVVVERCDQILRAGSASRSRRETLAKLIGLNIPENAVEDVAELLMSLPLAADVPNAQRRLSLLSNPVTTFSELWRQYVTCGFSTQEKSDPDTPLGRFAKSKSPLLDLQSVLVNGEDSEWIAEELAAAGVKRKTPTRKKLVMSARHAFVAAMGHDDLLINGRTGCALSIFVNLALGHIRDHEISTSAEFSESIDAKGLFGIGPKQIRNILVNTGLGHNVIPIDSRWKAYLGHRMYFTTNDLARRTGYLEVEDVIRKALILAQKRRSDIPNLAVLDSIVFAVQSSTGHTGEGWAGGQVRGARQLRLSATVQSPVKLNFSSFGLG